MAWRLKIFLLLLCLTGVCMFCFQQVLVPFTTSFSLGSENRHVHRSDDDGFANAKLLIDNIQKRVENQQPKRLTNDEFGKIMKGSDSESKVQNLSLPHNYEVAEHYVTVSANGSLLYESEAVTLVTMSDERLGTDKSTAFGITTTPSPEALIDEHAARIQHLQEQCKRLPTLKTSLLGRSNITDFYYSPKHRFAYCKVPKSGSTFWMQLFMLLGKGNRYSRLMSRWTRAQIHERSRRLQTNPVKILNSRVPTIIVSRNPYTRLYSAYIDKVFMPLFWEQFQSIPSVIKLAPIYVNKTVRALNVTSEHGRPESLRDLRYRPAHARPNRLQDRPSDLLLRARYKRVNFRGIGRNASDQYRDPIRPISVTKLVKIFPICANHVTFEEFLRFIISKAKQRKPLEPHWAPITHLCRPCRFNTSKIVRQESFATDVDYSLWSFGIDISEYEGLKQSLAERRAEASIPGIVGVLMAKAVSPETQKCISAKEIASRIWKSFQIQGFIRDDLQLPRELPDDIRLLKTTLIKLALEAVKRTNFTRVQQKTQRRKHLVEAYKGVSSDVIRDIQSVYSLDFNLFNYSLTPPHLEA